MSQHPSSSRPIALRASIGLSVAMLAISLVVGEQVGAGPSAPGLDSAVPTIEPFELRYVAILPPINRSGRPIPADEIRKRLAIELELLRGIDVLEHEELDEFMRRHRMRYTGGVNSGMARLFDIETNTSAVLITSVDLFSRNEVPALALTCRLVSTEDEPRILWMSSAVRTGDQKPGAFELGLISDLGVVMDDVISQIVASIPREGDTPEEVAARSARRRTKVGKFRPKVYYSSPDLSVIRRDDARVVVLPFANDSSSKYVGEIVSDQLIRQLVAMEVQVVEPGVVRQTLLEARQVYPEGPSLPETDILRVSLNAGLVFYGEVAEYKESGPINPQAYVEFLVRATDTERHEVIWSSASYGGANKGVFFFGLGHVPTAHHLASRMVADLVWAVGRADDADRKRR